MTDMSERIKAMAAHTYGTWGSQKGWKAPLLITDAEGVYFFDSSGKRYIDFSSQLMCSNLGHKNKVVIEAIVKQAEKLPYVAPSFVTEILIEAVEALRSFFPEKLSKFFFSTSGTAANEAAMKMLRQYKFPAYKVISRYRSYHGATAVGQAFTGDPRRWYAELARTVVDGVVFAPDNYCYRCPFAMTYPQCNVQCARYLDYMIKEEGNVAAIVVEPIVGTNDNCGHIALFLDHIVQVTGALHVALRISDAERAAVAVIVRCEDYTVHHRASQLSVPAAPRQMKPP